MDETLRLFEESSSHEGTIRDPTEAKKLYRTHAGLAELPNAHQKTHHGISQVLVRGISKVTCVILLNAIGSNILQHAPRLLS